MEPKHYTAFVGTKRLAGGHLAEVALAAKRQSETGTEERLVIFDDSTGRTIDLDLRGTDAEILARLPEEQAAPTEPVQKESRRGPGRPRLGVVAREVTLLPRHWEWLNRQPSGASAALRRLVESAMRANRAADQERQRREAAYWFMSEMAGNRANFEEATRQLFSKNDAQLFELIREWPEDIQAHIRWYLTLPNQNDASTSTDPQ